jgi:hypothetical protein
MKIELAFPVEAKLSPLGSSTPSRVPIPHMHLTRVCPRLGQLVPNHSNAIRFLVDPKCSIFTSTISPSFNHTGFGFMPNATPEGVPVIMTVPCSKVVP